MSNGSSVGKKLEELGGSFPLAGVVWGIHVIYGALSCTLRSAGQALVPRSRAGCLPSLVGPVSGAGAKLPRLPGERQDNWLSAP